MDAYVYQAAMLCEECGEKLRAELTPADDSDNYPQGPYSDGGGESDCPEHCDKCGEFLENPLTQHGYDYLREMLDGNGNHEVLQQWREFYPEAYEQ